MKVGIFVLNAFGLLHKTTIKYKLEVKYNQ
ncbi:hypothetical protein SAMN06297358_3679 [Pedobacter xixiisoli]|uniref:Uncharacterized protein n=1 Tax=Pedobacter xixiisoli TaxID=1476464 RepID=A0A286ADJ4_9SPHI|nr:hypothetical protein SAMN06297358_3679 [Pedobacter xixiisoli]